MDDTVQKTEILQVEYNSIDIEFCIRTLNKNNVVDEVAQEVDCAGTLEFLFTTALPVAHGS